MMPSRNMAQNSAPADQPGFECSASWQRATAGPGPQTCGVILPRRAAARRPALLRETGSRSSRIMFRSASSWMVSHQTAASTPMTPSSRPRALHLVTPSSRCPRRARVTSKASRIPWGGRGKWCPSAGRGNRTPWGPVLGAGQVNVAAAPPHTVHIAVSSALACTTSGHARLALDD